MLAAPCVEAFQNRKGVGAALPDRSQNLPNYIDDDHTGICPVCGVNLSARAKVVTHTAESCVSSKRSKLQCRDIILGGVRPFLPATAVERLNAQDAVLLRSARGQGHSDVQTTWPA